MQVPESSQPTIKASLLARVSQILGPQFENMRSRTNRTSVALVIRICLWVVSILSMGRTSASQDIDGCAPAKALIVTTGLLPDSDSGSKEASWQLPTGGKIELLGVSTPPIKLPSKDEREWWKGDGTVLAAPPIRLGFLSVGQDKSDGREFAIRASGFIGQLSLDVRMTQLFKDGQPLTANRNGWSNSRTQSDRLNGFQTTIEYVAGPVGEADTATLELRLASSERCEIRFVKHGQRIEEAATIFNDAQLDAAVHRMSRRVKVLRAGPHEDGFAVWTTPFSFSSDDGFVTLAFRGTDGEDVHSGGQSDGTEQIFISRMRPENLREFAFQFYPYDELVTIQNVSLRAGHRSDPVIAIQPNARKRIKEQDARKTLGEEYRDLIEFVPAVDGLEDLHVRNLPISGWQFVSLLTGIHSIEIQGGDVRNGPLRQIAEIPGLKSVSIVDARCLPEDLTLLADHLTLESLSVALTTPDELADAQERQRLWYYTSFAERDWIEKNLTRLNERFPDAALNRHRLEAAVLTDRELWDLTELTSLRSLRLVTSPISTRGFKAFRQFPQLQHLSIEIIDQTAETGLELASFPALQSLGQIEGNPEVLRELKNSKTLEELEVTNLRDDGVEDLIGIFRLKKLHLRGSSLSDEGLMKLSRLDQLAELSFEATKGTITDDGIAHLRSQLPDCRLTGDVLERTKD